jgi:hypothetical protein
VLHSRKEIRSNSGYKINQGDNLNVLRDSTSDSW